MLSGAHGIPGDVAYAPTECVDRSSFSLFMRDTNASLKTVWWHLPANSYLSISVIFYEYEGTTHELTLTGKSQRDLKRSNDR